MIDKNPCVFLSNFVLILSEYLWLSQNPYLSYYIYGHFMSVFPDFTTFENDLNVAIKAEYISL